MTGEASSYVTAHRYSWTAISPNDGCPRSATRGSWCVANAFNLGLPAFLLLLLSACVERPTPTVREHYIQQRLSAPFIDRTKPCRYSKLRPFPLKLGANHIFIPVALNGVMTTGMLDTGAAISLFTPEIVQAAHVEADKGRAHTFRGLGGSATVPQAFAQSLGFGSFMLNGRIPIHVLSFGGSKGTQFGALIGQDMLDGMDYDIDLPHGLFTPYRTSNCMVINPPWQDSYTGIAVTRGAINGESTAIVELATTLSLRLGASVPVFFADRKLEALFDTGAGMSVMSRAGARSLGVTDEALQADKPIKSAGLTGVPTELRLHVFDSVTIGEDDFHNLPIAVIPAFDRRDTFPMVLGMDYIANHHLWLSYTTNALYIDSGEKPSIVRLPPKTAVKPP